MPSVSIAGCLAAIGALQHSHRPAAAAIAVTLVQGPATMRFAVLAAFVLLATSLIADASRTAPQSPPANAQVRGFNQLPMPSDSLNRCQSDGPLHTSGTARARSLMWALDPNQLHGRRRFKLSNSGLVCAEHSPALPLHR